MAIPTIPEPFAKKLRAAIKKGKDYPPEVIERDGHKYVRFNTMEVTVPNKWDTHTTVRWFYNDEFVLEMKAPKVSPGDTLTLSGMAGFSELRLD